MYPASVQCFVVIHTGKQSVYLRRYKSGEDKCPVEGYHNALVHVGTRDTVADADGYDHEPSVRAYKDDARWPTHCACGYAFKQDDVWQVFTDRLYAREDDAKAVFTWREAAPGAMMTLPWLESSCPDYGVVPDDGVLSWWKGPDNHVWQVKCPNGRDWLIDSRATNCTLPTDNAHRCWVRHGDAPSFTVDKNGLSCNAGAGSIQCGDYHGFLRNGYLVIA